jgi:hypothetical protein
LAGISIAGRGFVELAAIFAVKGHPKTLNRSPPVRVQSRSSSATPSTPSISAEGAADESGWAIQHENLIKMSDWGMLGNDRCGNSLDLVLGLQGRTHDAGRRTSPVTGAFWSDWVTPAMLWSFRDQMLAARACFNRITSGSDIARRVLAEISEGDPDKV